MLDDLLHSYISSIEVDHCQTKEYSLELETLPGSEDKHRKQSTSDYLHHLVRVVSPIAEAKQSTKGKSLPQSLPFENVRFKRSSFMTATNYWEA